jgi:hypothetical protein
MSEYVAKSKSSSIGQKYSVASHDSVSIVAGTNGTYGAKATTYVSGSTVQLNDAGSKGSVTSSSPSTERQISEGIDNGDYVK